MLALRGVTNKYAFQHGVLAEHNPSPPYLCCSFVCTPTYWCRCCTPTERLTAVVHRRAETGGAECEHSSSAYCCSPLFRPSPSVPTRDLRCFGAVVPSPDCGGVQAGGASHPEYSALHRLCPLAWCFGGGAPPRSASADRATVAGRAVTWLMQGMPLVILRRHTTRRTICSGSGSGWGVAVFRAPSSGGAQAGGDGGGGVATAVQSSALPFSALHRLCPLAVGGVPVVAVLFVLFAL